MKKMMLSILFFIFTATVNGQAANVLVWDYPVALTEVQTYTQSVSVNGTFQSGTPACVATTTTLTTCSLTVNNISTTTSNTVVVAANKAGVSAMTTITGLNINNAPKNPTNPRIQINVTINLP